MKDPLDERGDKALTGFAFSPSVAVVVNAGDGKEFEIQIIFYPKQIILNPKYTLQQRCLHDANSLASDLVFDQHKYLLFQFHIIYSPLPLVLR